jgi:roadblock/LC7 domain-containing protein
MPANLEKVLELEGVESAVEFTDDGKIVGFAGAVTEETANLMADLFATNMKMARWQANLFTALTGISGFDEELTGFSIKGPELSFCVIENIGIFFKNATSDLNEIYRELSNI